MCNLTPTVAEIGETCSEHGPHQCYHAPSKYSETHKAKAISLFSAGWQPLALTSPNPFVPELGANMGSAPMALVFYHPSQLKTKLLQFEPRSSVSPHPSCGQCTVLLDSLGLGPHSQLCFETEHRHSTYVQNEPSCCTACQALRRSLLLLQA